MSYSCINRNLTFSAPVAQQHADHFELYLKHSFSFGLFYLNVRRSLFSYRYSSKCMIYVLPMAENDM